MSKFTPGPWKVIMKSGEWEVIKDNGILNNAYGRQIICREIEQGTDNGEADAHLIAAAPDLLEALTEIVEGDNMILVTSHYKAKTAIAKATNQNQEA